ncbi:MAG: hypothetical protein AAB414_04960 [Patescibacteria group bacterium]
MEQGPENTEFTEGSRVVNDGGDSGIFLGTTDRDGVTYARFKFDAGGGESYITTVPLAAASKRFKPESQQREVLDKIAAPKMAVIQEVIDEYKGLYLSDALEFQNLSNSQEQAIEQLQEELEDGDFVFRGDTRHPYAQSELDKKFGIAQGPFQEGLSPHPDIPERRISIDGAKSAAFDFETINDVDQMGWITWTTPDPRKTLGYPILDDMPADWDRKAFVYIINARGLAEDPRYLDYDSGYNEVISGPIPARFIHSAIERKVGQTEHDSQFVAIHRNPNYKV